MTDEQHAQEWAGRICERLSLDAHDDEEIVGSELLPLVQAVRAAARAEALEDAAKHSERVYGELRLEFLLRMADEIRALAAQSSPEAAE